MLYINIVLAIKITKILYQNLSNYIKLYFFIFFYIKSTLGIKMRVLCNQFERIWLPVVKYFRKEYLIMKPKKKKPKFTKAEIKEIQKFENPEFIVSVSIITYEDFDT